MTNTAHIAHRFASALGGRNFPELSALLAPHAQLNARVPARSFQAVGSAEVVGTWEGWLDWPRAVEVDEVRVAEVGDRVTMTWLSRLLTDDPEIGDRVMEQHLVLYVEDGLIERIDLICTGMRRIETATDASVHEFDAGNRGCTDGFPSEFRRRIRACDVGARLRVVAADPSAKQDVPSLARLMGHRLIDVTDLPDGRTAFTVERGR
jgi:TusA-related sulfurtransferase